MDGFAPISALLIINSLSTTASDLGLGLSILRLGPDERIASKTRNRVFKTNILVAILPMLAAAAARGTTAMILLASGLLWVFTAHAYILKATAHWALRDRSIAAAEAGGSIALAVAVVIAVTIPTRAVEAAAIGLCVKALVEILVLRNSPSPFDSSGGIAPLRQLWIAQVLSYASGNVDFLIAVVILGPRALSVYVVAFRVASAIPSQVANVAGRLAVVDFAQATLPNDLRHAYSTYLKRVLAVGVTGAGVTLAVAPLVAWLLGHEWSTTAWVVAVLAISVPWRMLLTVASSAILTDNTTSLTMHLEVTRLVLTAFALAAGAAAGFSTFAGIAAAIPVFAALAYQEGLHRLRDIPMSRFSRAGAVASLAAIAIVSSAIAAP